MVKEGSSIVSANKFIEILLQDFEINNIQVEGEVILNEGLRFSRNVKIENCQFDGGLNVVGAVFEKALTMESVTFSESLMLSIDSCCKGDVNIDKCDFRANFYIGGQVAPKRNMFCKSFCIHRSKFNNFGLHGTNISGSFSFTNCEVVNECRIWGISTHDLSLEWNVFKQSSYFLFEEVRDSEIGVSADQTASISLMISNVRDLSVGGKINCSLTLNKSSANRFSLWGQIFKEGTVKIEDLETSHFKIGNLLSLGNLDLYNIQPSTSNPSDTSVTFEGANLGSCTFNSFDFASFKNHRFYGVIIEKIVIKGKHFPTKACLNELNQFDGGYNNYYELYNQLYTAMRQQGDRVNELRYYASAMECHRKDLKGKKQYGNLILLYLNKYSTNYGQNWIQGVLVTVGAGIVFYSLYVFSTPQVELSISNHSWALTWDLLGDFFIFLNPAHRADFIPHLTLTTYSKIIDFFGRITTGFMIYQTVVAFRRLGLR